MQAAANKGPKYRRLGQSPGGTRWSHVRYVVMRCNIQYPSPLKDTMTWKLRVSGHSLADKGILVDWAGEVGQA